MTVYIVASGGGHTGYGIALAESLRELNRDIDIAFVVDPRDRWSVERINRRLGSSKYVFVTKPRKPLESSLKLIERLPTSLLESLRGIRSPEAVVATGSNHSIAPIVAGLLKRSPVVMSIEAIDRIHTCSSANKKLHDYFRVRIALSWSEQLRHYKRGVVVGPIYERPIYEAEDRGYVLVLSGSVGHVRLFDLLLKTDLDRVVVQTGSVDPAYITSKKPHWKAFSFDPDIDSWISKASVVIGHQGLSVAEAALAYGKPVVLAYNRDLPQTSGLRDSMMLAEKLNGVFVDPSGVDPKEFVELVEKARRRRPPVYASGATNLAKMIVDLLSYAGSTRYSQNTL